MLTSIYFVDGKAKSAAEIYEKVSIWSFLFARELPQATWDNDRGGDSWPDTLFVGSKIGLLDVLKELPQRRSFNIYAIAPTGVRDKFYAWILPLNVDIKDAFVDFWVTLGMPEEVEKLNNN